MRRTSVSAVGLAVPLVLLLVVGATYAAQWAGPDDRAPVLRGDAASARSAPVTVGMLAYAGPGPDKRRYEIYTILTDGSHRRQLTTGGGYGPVWSPDGTRIAYQRRDEIWVMDAADAPGRRLVEGSSPAWAPNGNVIAYGCAGGADLCSVDLQTGETSVLVAHTDEWPAADSPTWSPDGEWIAFTRYGTGGEYESPRSLFRIRAGGSDITLIPKAGTRVSSPAWSPDGTSILYVIPGDARSGEFQADLWSIRPDGTGSSRVTRTFGDEGGGAWSPDGHRIVAHSAGGVRPDQSGIWTMDPDGTDLELVVRVGSNASWRPNFEAATEPPTPTASTSGKKIAYVASTDEGFDLFTVRPDGTHARRLTSTGGIGEISWSPDHTKIAFGDNFPVGAIFVMDLGTQQITRVAGSFSYFDNFQGLAWSPDGRRLAWVEYRELVTYDLPTRKTTRFALDGIACCARDLTWSPNGRLFAFILGNTGDIRVVSPQGGKPRRVIHVAGQETSLDWSPEGGQILFTNRQGYYGTARSRLMSVRPDGTSLRTITRGGAYINQSAWSPSGARLAYYSDGPRPFGPSPRPGLWTAGEDGTTPQLVVSGRSIAYVDW